MVNTANLCIFEGRIARDPQYSTVQIGQDNVEKALFTLAVDRALSAQQRQKVKNGDQSIKTADFIPCSLLGAQVGTLRQYCPQGKAIRVIGRYTEYQTTDAQSGQKKYGHMFEIDSISFTTQDSKNVQQNQGQQNNTVPQNNGYQATPNTGYQQAAAPAPAPGGFSMFDEGESPF